MGSEMCIRDRLCTLHTVISSARQSRVPATVRASKQGGGWGGAAPPALQADCQEKLDSKCYNSKLNFMQIYAAKSLNIGITCRLNPPKILPKSLKKTSKIQVRRHQNRGLEGSGQLLGASWLQETSQTLRGHLLDVSGEALGADSN